MTIIKVARAAAAAVLTAAAVVTAAAPAGADAPVRTVEPLDFTIVDHPYYSEVCGFPVTLHVWGDFLVRTWLDEEGDLVREFRNFRFRSTTEANGKVVEGIAVGPETLTANADGSTTVMLRGITNRRVPGEGTVRISVGFGLVIRPADGGEEVVLTPTRTEDMGPMCDYLAA
jgi:hypothetical protein